MLLLIYPFVFVYNSSVCFHLKVTIASLQASSVYPFCIFLSPSFSDRNPVELLSCFLLEGFLSRNKSSFTEKKCLEVSVLIVVSELWDLNMVPDSRISWFHGKSEIDFSYPSEKMMLIQRLAKGCCPLQLF